MRQGIDFRARDGRPLDTISWAQLFEDPDYRRVAMDRIGPLIVSTVWIGYDTHLWRSLLDRSTDRAPAVFELVVFAWDAPDIAEIGPPVIGPIPFRGEDRAVDAHRMITGCLAGMRAITQGH